MKYKNKNGIELSYEGRGSDIHAELVKEVIKEAIKIGNAEIYTKYPRQGWIKVKEFINENFSLDD
jgi:ribosome-interacting GTPase 1